MESSLHCQVSFAAATFVLENTRKFRGFFRVLPSFELLGPAITKIMVQFNWTQFMVVDQEDALFEEVMFSGVVSIFLPCCILLVWVLMFQEYKKLCNLK